MKKVLEPSMHCRPLTTSKMHCKLNPFQRALKTPFESSSFARETDLKDLAFAVKDDKERRKS